MRAKAGEPSASRETHPVIVPLIVAIFCAIALAYGLKTGNIPISYGTSNRQKEPFLYWFAVGILSILLGFMLLLWLASLQLVRFGL